MNLSAYKILVVAPNYQPEQCGISDYVNVLKHYLKNFNCEAIYIIALSDRYVTEVIKGADYLRIPFKYSYQLRLGLFKEIVEHFSPTHLIFNFVPYGFSTKGLPLWLLQYKNIFPAQTKVAVVMHELWTGDHKAFKWKVKALGNIQRRIITRLLSKFAPSSIITTSQYTTQLLQKRGFRAMPCRVFSNITSNPDPNDVPLEIVQLMSGANQVNVIFFGSITNDSSSQEIIGFFSKIRTLYMQPINIIATGSLKTSSNTIWQELKYLDVEGIRFFDTGHLSAAGVAWIMLRANIGLSTYPIELWSKSGGIAAMLAHGLPVIVFGSIHMGEKLINNKLSHENLYYWQELRQGNLAAAISRHTKNNIENYNWESFQRIFEGLKL